MPQLTSRRKRSPMAAAILLLVLAGTLLAACGGSSNSATTTASTSASTGTSATKATPGKAPAFSARFAAIRECLKKEGITLPAGKPGQPGAGGLLGGGSAALPAGVSRSKLEAALKKCGGNFLHRRGSFAGGTSRFSSPEGKKALAKFAACLRENGVKVGEPNTSGKGSVFNTTGINTKSAQFKAAEAKCRSDLAGAFGARPGAGAPGAPGAGAGG